MKSHNKIDPQVAKIMKAAQSKTSPVHVSLVTYNTVLCYGIVTPTNLSEEIRMKRNISTDEDARPGAFQGKITNSSEGAYVELMLDGKVLAYDIVREAVVTPRDGSERVHNYTRYNLDWAWLCINGRRVERVYSAEGLKKLIG